VGHVGLRPADDDDAALGLAWLSQYGCSPLLQLISSRGPSALWHASRRQLAEWGLTMNQIERYEQRREAFSADEAAAKLQSCGVEFIPFGASHYPPELLQLKYPPAGLFCKGSEEVRTSLLSASRITLVGTRRSTAYGARVADLFASAFAENAIAVVSGLALGIDGRAHRVSLSSRGLSMAVLGCGVDVVYPAAHRQLYAHMRDKGLLMSELPPGTRPTRWTFPHRNRILAALGDATLVVEGSRKSGAMQTARMALDLGRPVFAVPGPITGETSSGCNWLIYDGAAPAIDPCVTVEEFLLRTRMDRGERDLKCQAPFAVGSGHPRDSEEWGRVLDGLQCGAASIDGLSSMTGMGVREVAKTLAELEVSGLVARSSPGLYIRAP
jgi:DNA processing protein